MPGPDPYVVKRYANRKLYDTVLRRFTTLDDVARLLEQGTQVIVRDHSTGADRTDEILGQVLGRRVSRTPGGTDLIAGLLRAPAQIAHDVAGTLGDPARLTGSGSRDKVHVELEDDEPAAKKPKAKKKSGSASKGEQKTGQKPNEKPKEKPNEKPKEKARKKARADDPTEDPEELLRRQQAEIRELRGQVSELTAAVTLLLKEKSAELEAEAAAANEDDEDEDD